MLALHVLSAFAIAAALVLYSVLVYSGRRMKTREDRRLLFSIAPIGTPLIAGGSVVALILGMVVAVDADEFVIWAGWVIGGIVLWELLGGAGERTGESYTAGPQPAGTG